MQVVRVYFNLIGLLTLILSLFLLTEKAFGPCVVATSTANTTETRVSCDASVILARYCNGVITDVRCRNQSVDQRKISTTWPACLAPSQVFIRDGLLLVCMDSNGGLHLGLRLKLPRVLPCRCRGWDTSSHISTVWSPPPLSLSLSFSLFFFFFSLLSPRPLSMFPHSRTVETAHRIGFDQRYWCLSGFNLPASNTACYIPVEWIASASQWVSAIWAEIKERPEVTIDGN